MVVILVDMVVTGHCGGDNDSFGGDKFSKSLIDETHIPFVWQFPHFQL